MVFFEPPTDCLRGLRRWLWLAAMLVAPMLHAANGTWTNTASGGSWSAFANWNTSVIADGSGFTADFNSINIATDPTVVHLDSARTIGNLIFGDTGTNSAASWTLDNNGVGANVLTLAGGTPTITVNTLAGGKVATISATLAGTAGLTKAGAGTLVVAGANTNTGALTVSAGTFKLGSTGALGDGVNNSSSLVVSGSGILDLAGISPVANPPLTLNSTANGFDVGAFYNSASSTSVYTGPITLGRQTRIGAGNVLLTGAITGGGFNLIKDGVNTLELTNSGNVTFGALQINRGALTVDAGVSLNFTGINIGSGNSVGSTLTLNGGTVSCSGFTQFGTGSGNASGTLNLNGGTLTVTNFAKGNVTFNVNFNGGTLKAGASNPNFLTNASNLKVLAGGAVIDDGGFAIAILPALADTNLPSNGGGLSKLGGGTLTLAGTNTFSGATLIKAGTLALSGYASLASTPLIFVNTNATFDVSGLSNALTLTARQILSNAPMSTARLAGDLNTGTGLLALDFKSPTPAFTVTNGTLTISSGTVININNSGAQLAAGSYKIISKAATGNVGAVAGSFPSWITVGGAGAVGMASLQITSGELFLVIAPPGGSKIWNGPAGGDLATAGNWSPTGVPTDNTTATFSNNALNTTNLLLNGALPGGSQAYGVLLNITQTNAVNITVNTGPRLYGVIVNAGAGALTFTNGTTDAILWSGVNANLSLPLVNNSTNPVTFAAGLRMPVGGGSTYTKTLSFSGAGDWYLNGILGSATGAHLAITKSGFGTVTLGGSTTNSFDGAITLNNGTLRLLNAGLLTNTPGVTMLAGAVLDVSSGGFDVITNQTLEGNGTCLGDVTVDAGATVQPDLDVTPLTFSNNLTLAGTMQFNLNRTNFPNTGKIVVAQTFTNSGTLMVLNAGPALVAGDSFDLFDVASKQGSFAQVLLPPVRYGLRWNTNQLASAGIILVETNTSLVPANITLNPATTYQTIHGIGANFCLGPQGIAWNDTQFNLAFSPTNLNISFVRLANSFECWLDEPSIFWSGWDSDNVRFIQMYRAMQTNGLITMSAWSPPGSLKSTGSAMGGTIAKTNSLYRYTDYADWWLRSLQYLRDNSTLSVTQALPDFISIQNECDFTPSGTFYAAWQAGNYLASTESSTKAGYPQALAAVKAALQTNGLGFVKFIGPDTTTGSSGTISSYLNNLPAGSLAAIAHHPYQGSVNDVGHNTSSLSGLRAAYPTNTIYMTEFFGDDSYGTNVPAWMMHALPMHNLFTIEQANTYLMWGLSVSPSAASFCALGHYSKFINPRDRRANVTSSDPAILASLYRRTNSTGIADQLVVVLINNTNDYRYPTIVTSNYWANDPLQRAWKFYLTADDGSSNFRLALMESESGAGLTGNRNLVLPPYSMATLVINTGIFSNASPVFTSVTTNQIVNPGQTVNLTNTATDPNMPAQTIAFTLSIGPTNATLNATNGILNWRPLIAQANTTNLFRVVVSDSATPSLSATQNFSVTVSLVTSPLLGNAKISNGLFSLSIGGAAGPDYTVQASTNLTTWNTLLTTNPTVLPFLWTDTNTAGFTRRFYRTVLGP
jgi:autotransporter-associated beta strand protein